MFLESCRLQPEPLVRLTPLSRSSSRNNALPSQQACVHLQQHSAMSLSILLPNVNKGGGTLTCDCHTRPHLYAWQSLLHTTRLLLTVNAAKPKATTRNEARLHVKPETP